VLAEHGTQRRELAAEREPLRSLEPGAHHQARRDEQVGIERAQSFEHARGIVDAIEREQLTSERPQIVAQCAFRERIASRREQQRSALHRRGTESRAPDLEHRVALVLGTTGRHRGRIGVVDQPEAEQVLHLALVARAIEDRHARAEVEQRGDAVETEALTDARRTELAHELVQRLLAHGRRGAHRPSSRPSSRRSWAATSAADSRRCSTSTPRSSGASADTAAQNRSRCASACSLPPTCNSARARP